MNSRNFYEFGEELQKIVQTAIDSNDFKELNAAVRSTVNDVVEAVRSGVTDTMVKMKEQQEKKTAQAQEEPVDAVYKETETPTEQRFYKETEAPTEQMSYKQRELVQAQYFVSRPKGEIMGTTMIIVGFFMATLFGIAFAGVAALNVVFEGLSLLNVPLAVLAVLTILMLLMGIKGRKMTSRAGRFRQYRKALDDQEFCDIAKLAEEIGRKDEFVVRDVKGMIESGWFRQGHLDKQETCLIITDKMYEQYELAQKSLEGREAKERAEAEKMADPKYTEEVRSMLIEGKRYVQHIRECNDAVPGEDISAKMARLELIVSKIFAQVEKNPAVAPDLHQFMNYYLPTTEKLLDVYRDLDDQPLQGQNIIDTKKEIEATLDTLNQAFEKLLDSFYKDMAWDISTDISVLNTMLAEEGLTEDELQSQINAEA